MHYEERMNRAVDFIGQHLDEVLTLQQLSDAAYLSKYHFHRLFTVYTGVPVAQYIRWLRLKRAAHQLCVNRSDSVMTIALNAGFESHEAFSRAFKQMCGASPASFRLTPHWDAWKKPTASSNNTGEIKVDVTLKEWPARRLAAIEHRGDPQQLGASVGKLITWAKAQPMNLRPKPGEAFGFGYHDPKTVSAEDFRFDLAISIPEDFKLAGEIIEKRLPSGRYAVVVHIGSRRTIGDTIYGLYRDWLPNSGEELEDFPCVFRYHNFDHEVAETELRTEIGCLLT